MSFFILCLNNTSDFPWDRNEKQEIRGQKAGKSAVQIRGPKKLVKTIIQNRSVRVAHAQKSKHTLPLPLKTDGIRII